MYQKVFADSLPLSEKTDDTPAYLIAGVSFDGTSSFRSGSSRGPAALREASYNYESYLISSKVDLADVPIFDAGDMEEAGSVAGMREILRMELESIYSHHTELFPIILGGEHSLTPGVLEFLNNRMTIRGSKLGVIYLDAHMDFRDEYLGIEFSHACSARRSADIVGTDNIIPVGIRSFSREEKEYLAPLLAESRFRYYSTFHVLERKGEAIALEAMEILKSNGCDMIYLSVDMDVLDPSEAPGVGNPEPGGLCYFDVIDIIRILSPHLCGMDLVEVNPVYDQGITALLGARIIRETIGFHHSEQLKMGE